jgi:hypothetical protein
MSLMIVALLFSLSIQKRARLLGTVAPKTATPLTGVGSEKIFRSTRISCRPQLLVHRV